MVNDKGESTQASLIERFRKSWFPPAAVVAAFGAFIAAAMRGRPEVKATARPANSPPAPGSLVQLTKPSPQVAGLSAQYTPTAVLCGPKSAKPFRNSLSGVAVGLGDTIYALGDGEVRIFDPEGMFIRGWKIPENSECLAVSPDGRVYIAGGNRIEIFDNGGNRTAAFKAGDAKRPAVVTAIKIYKNEILVADAASRMILRYDASGKRLGVIGDKSKAGSFILPNKSLDIAVDAGGIVRATDTGRHQVTAWSIDGSPRGGFGKFGMSDPSDFVGCCNPVNLAMTPDGKIVTGEKMVARVKVYEPDGKLIAVIGPEHFDPMCIHIHLAVDSKGRILAADPVRLEINVFAPASKSGSGERKIEEPEKV
jgi:hypothetical protein